MQFVNFSQSIFHANNENYVFNSYEDWSDKNDEIYDECKEKLILKVQDNFKGLNLNSLSKIKYKFLFLQLYLNSHSFMCK